MTVGMPLPVQLHRGRKPHHEVEEVDVEEGHAPFERVRHRHAVYALEVHVV